NVVRAREVLRLATGLSGSSQESQLRWLALAIGLPEPICEWEQWIDGNQYFSDFAWLATAPDWPRRAITLEYDGESKYGSTPESILRAVAEEKWRADAIESATSSSIGSPSIASTTPPRPRPGCCRSFRHRPAPSSH